LPRNPQLGSAISCSCWRSVARQREGASPQNSPQSSQHRSLETHLSAVSVWKVWLPKCNAGTNTRLENPGEEVFSAVLTLTWVSELRLQFVDSQGMAKG
jgi:hypothetical protein